MISTLDNRGERVRGRTIARWRLSERSRGHRCARVLRAVLEDKSDRRGDTHFRARSWAGTAEAIPVSTLENRHVSRSIRWSTPRTGAHCFGCRLCPASRALRYSSGISRCARRTIRRGAACAGRSSCGRRTSSLLRDHWRNSGQAVRAPTREHAARGGITAGAVSYTAHRSNAPWSA